MPLPRHRVLAQVNNLPRLQQLLADVCPQALARLKISSRARTLIDEARSAIPPEASWPTTVKECTDEWISGEVERRQSAAALNTRLTVLDDMQFNAVQDAIEIVETASVQLVEALAKQFEDLLDRLADEVAKLDGATTAAEAIAAGPEATAAWSTITTDLVGEYDEIRHVQLVLYQCDALSFDRLRCGDEDPASYDPEARLFRHRNLNTVAPNWRGSYSDSAHAERRPEYPWPADPVERLVWFVASDSGMWLPTPSQISELLAHGPEMRPEYVAQLVGEPA